mgnify:FL=1
MKYISFKLNKEFRRLYGRGKCLVLPQVVIYYKRNNLPYCRVGVSVSKKLGGAVQRNRAKRVMLAAFRQILPQLPYGYDFVFAGRVKTTKVKSTAVYVAMQSALQSEGVLPL